MSNDSKPVLDHLATTSEARLERLCHVLRFPSVGTDSAFDKDTRACAEWLVNDLKECGLKAELRETEGQPLVYAHHPGPGGDAPHILYYGHYDVQPADPLELWDSPPFEPTIIEGKHGKRVVARGAVDDKGQVRTILEALRAWHDVNETFPFQVSVLIEGEEESGSHSLPGYLSKHAEELKADVCIISDTGMWNIDTPAITTMLRGVLSTEVTLHGPDHDLHSGMYGGAVANPINGLALALGQLIDAEGRIQIPGFYDGIIPITEQQKQQWAELGFSEEETVKDVGMTAGTGEAGFSALERIWARPTCDLNGIIGGYTGEGGKTIIASKASSKISCRLVPGMDGDKIATALQEFFEARTPPGCHWEFGKTHVAPAIRVPTESCWVDACCEALTEIYDKEAVLIGCGGSIPVAAFFKDILDLDCLLVGFGLDDDRIHSPNEKFELTCLEKGAASHVAMIAHFAKCPAGMSC